jgi:hypothetical protein
MVFLLSKAEKRQNEPETLSAGSEFPGLAYDLKLTLILLWGLQHILADR